MTVIGQYSKRKVRVRNQSFFRRLARQWQLALMSVPIFLYVLLFNYFPMWGWRNAFLDYSSKKLVARGITPYIGWDNFKWLFSRQDFLLSIRNTLAMSIINLVFGTVSAIVAMAQNIFASNGPINDLLGLVGIKPVFWLGEGKHFWWLVGIINVWKEVGWGTIIYISAMTAIDPALYEAAAIDGAGRFQRIMHVTLPGIKSTFVILLIMNIGHLMEAGFEIQYLLGNGLTAEYSRTIDVFVLEYGTSQMDFGVATAAGIFKSVVAIILLLGANFISKRLGEETLV